MGSGLQQLPVAEVDALARLHENGLRRICELQVRLTMSRHQRMYNCMFSCRCAPAC